MNIYLFVKNNYDLLSKYCDRKLIIPQLYDIIMTQNIKESYNEDSIILEMTKLPFEMTNLPCDIYIGPSDNSNYSGSMRIKFQNKKGDNNTRNWIPLIHSKDNDGNDCMIIDKKVNSQSYNLSKRDIEYIKQFGIINKEIIFLYSSYKIDINDFYKKMKKVNNK